MISNPVSFHQYSFVYEGGDKLYHMSPHDSGIPEFSHYMAFNLIFFANDINHAKDVVKRMLKFVIEANKDCVVDISKDYAKIILANIDKLKITLAPHNQFYQVGWACNDTV